MAQNFRKTNDLDPARTEKLSVVGNLQIAGRQCLAERSINEGNPSDCQDRAEYCKTSNLVRSYQKTSAKPVSTALLMLPGEINVTIDAVGWMEGLELAQLPS